MFIPIILILFYILKNGLSIVSLNFLISLPKPVGVSGSGIGNAIVGTIILIIIASFISIPLGIITGIYIVEHSNSRISKILILALDILQGAPSIILGLVAYLWIVLPMKRFSALAGGVALSFIMLPLIIKSTQESLNLIPFNLREASYALGVPHYRTILKVIVPAGLNGIITGILIGISRIIGETAPLLFTAFGNKYFNINPLKPVDSLPHIIFNYAISPFEDWHRVAWGTSFVLIIIVLSINLISRWVISKWKT